MMFRHILKNDCVLDKCLLMVEDGSAQLISTNLILNGISNYNIEAISTNPEGYSYTLRLQCDIKPIGLQPIISF